MTTEKYVIELHTRLGDHLFFGAGYCQSSALSLMHSLFRLLDPREVQEIQMIYTPSRQIIDLICLEEKKQ